MSEVEMSRLMLIRLGDGASGGREPNPLDVSKVSAPAATKATEPVSSNQTYTAENIPITTNSPPAGRAVLVARARVVMPRSSGTLVYQHC